MRRLERGPLAAGPALRRRAAADHPVVLGHEREALALALHDERKRGRLHAAGAAHVAKAAELREREIAGEHRTPDEVDVLTRLAALGQILVQVTRLSKACVISPLVKAE